MIGAPGMAGPAMPMAGVAFPMAAMGSGASYPQPVVPVVRKEFPETWMFDYVNDTE